MHIIYETNTNSSLLSVISAFIMKFYIYTGFSLNLPGLSVAVTVLEQRYLSVHSSRLRHRRPSDDRSRSSYSRYVFPLNALSVIMCYLNYCDYQEKLLFICYVFTIGIECQHIG